MSKYKPFSGAKLALFRKDHILTYLRDQRDDIPYPAMWDLPGGGREENENPESCVLRELEEEFGLTIPKYRLQERFTYSSEVTPLPCYFFTAIATECEIHNIQFGDEGQFWREVPVTQFLTDPNVVPELKKAVMRSKFIKPGQ